MKVLFKQFIIEQKLFYRNPISVFWTYMFPMFLLIIIGWFFNDSFAKRASGHNIILLSSNDNSKISQKIKDTLNTQFLIISKEDAKKLDIDPIPVHITKENDKNYSIDLTIKNTSISLDKSIEALEKLIKDLNHSNGLSISLKIKKDDKGKYKKNENNEKDYTKYTDFLAPGIIAMSVMSSCIFGVGISLTSYREKGHLRRLALTPLKKSTYVLAHILHRYAVIIIQSFFLLISAVLLFELEFMGDVLSLIVVLTVGLIAFISVGFIIASRTNKAESANALSNITFYPLLLLGAVYFPLSDIPEILRPLAKVTPLYHLTKALREVINTGTPFYLLTQNILPLIAISLICFFISVKMFRWE